MSSLALHQKHACQFQTYIAQKETPNTSFYPLPGQNTQKRRSSELKENTLQPSIASDN